MDFVDGVTLFMVVCVYVGGRGASHSVCSLDDLEPDW